MDRDFERRDGTVLLKTVRTTTLSGRQARWSLLEENVPTLQNPEETDATDVDEEEEMTDRLEEEEELGIRINILPRVTANKSSAIKLKDSVSISYLIDVSFESTENNTLSVRSLIGKQNLDPFSSESQ